MPEIDFRELAGGIEVNLKTVEDMRSIDYPENFFSFDQVTKTFSKLTSREGQELNENLIYTLENPNRPTISVAKCKDFPGELAVRISLQLALEGREVEFTGGAFVVIIDVSSSTTALKI